MELFSKELQILDENTVRYMIDVMQEELDTKDAKIDEMGLKLNEKDIQIEELALKVKELERQLRLSDNI